MADNGEYLAAWEQFKARERLASIDANEQRWQGCTAYVTFQISVASSQPIAEAVHHLQQQLAFPFVRLVPPRALHVTVQGVDCVERLAPEQMAALISEGRAALRSVGPFTLQNRIANSFAMAAILEVHDAGAIRAVRTRLHARLPWLLEQGRDPFVRDGQDSFKPHLSIGYYTAEAESQPVVEALEQFRGYEAGDFIVRQIELARVPIKSWDRAIEAIVELPSPG